MWNISGCLPKCTKCKVFGHSCAPKPGAKINTPNTVWQVVGKPPGSEGTSTESAKFQEDGQMGGKGKDTNSCLNGIAALEAVTVTVPNSTGAQFVIKPTDYEPSDVESSEDMDEVIEVETNPLTSSSGVEKDNSLMKSNNSDVSKEEFKKELDPSLPIIQWSATPHLQLWMAVLTRVIVRKTQGRVGGY